jgi:hypothetical protein
MLAVLCWGLLGIATGLPVIASGGITLFLICESLKMSG